MRPRDLPVAVVGAGPVGLAAAAHLHLRGLDTLVLEAGDSVGASIREWGHVRLFSPWRHLVDPEVERMLGTQGWTAPDPELLPSGQDLVARMLEPMAAHPGIAPSLKFAHRVVRIRRLPPEGNGAPDLRGPFELEVRTPGGTERILARAVVDASGTWRTPNPAGATGRPAEGEPAAAARLRVGIPDIGGRERSRYLGRRVAVVGSGHSAFHALLELIRLGRAAPEGEVHWIVRSPLRSEIFGGGGDDALPARGALGARLRQAVSEGRVQVWPEFRVGMVEGEPDDPRGTVTLVSDDGRRLASLDEVVVATGFHPELTLTEGLRLALDPVLECPVALAPLIDPTVHSCGTVPPHGFREVGHPEPDFYTIGMKSYGRAPTFLLLTGYEQARSVAAALAGALEEAEQVRLTLPETGVCSGAVDGPVGSGCCT